MPSGRQYASNPLFIESISQVTNSSQKTIIIAQKISMQSLYLINFCDVVQALKVEIDILKENWVLHLLVLDYLTFLPQLEIVVNTYLAAMKLVKIYLVPVSQNLYRTHEINLVFVHP